MVGVVSLHDIPPKPTHRRRAQHGTGASPDYTISNCQLNIYIEGSDCYAVTPADLATIYNFKPVFGAGNTGQNQTIYLIEDSDLFGGTSGGTNADWVTFRSTFGLSGTRRHDQHHPSGQQLLRSRHQPGRRRGHPRRRMGERRGPERRDRRGRLRRRHDLRPPRSRCRT